MEVFRSLDEIVTPARGSAIAIGKFDGVHRGHRAVMDQLLDLGAVGCAELTRLQAEALR